MPFIHIAVRRGREPEQIKAIADHTHAALVKYFDVPEDDRFQIVTQHEPFEFYYNSTYLNIGRSDALIYIHIYAGKLRSRETKLELYKKLAQTLSEHANVRPEDVMVVINTSGAEDWSFGNGQAQMLSSASGPAVS